MGDILVIHPAIDIVPGAQLWNERLERSQRVDRVEIVVTLSDGTTRSIEHDAVVCFEEMT